MSSVTNDASAMLFACLMKKLSPIDRRFQYLTQTVCHLKEPMTPIIMLNNKKMTQHCNVRDTSLSNVDIEEEQSLSYIQTDKTLGGCELN